MYNLNLIDQKVKKADSTLADFVVIAARAINQAQLTINDIEQIDLACEIGNELASTCDLPEQKTRFRFW
jgi:uncharacterized protein (DUF1778 family)